ncbi:MAG: hypothetical protein ABJL44_11065 [Algibacter sp.]
MHTCFYLICPTDCLEQTINKTFKHESYFYTSLGNSFEYDHKTIEYIKKIIEKHNIKNICFVLSINNTIVLDALINNNFSNIRGLHNFYTEIKKQKEHLKVAFKSDKLQFTLLSYYLNRKIKELRLQLMHASNQPIKINGKIFNKTESVFTTIYSDLVCLEKHQLN